MILESKCAKVDFYLYGESRGAPKWNIFDTEKLGLGQKYKNTIMVVGRIKRNRVLALLFVRRLLKCSKVDLCCTGKFELHQRGPFSYGELRDTPKWQQKTTDALKNEI